MTAARWIGLICGTAALLAASALLDVAAARVISALQYASDVVAGAALGFISTLLLGHLFSPWALAFEDEAGVFRLKGPGLLSATLPAGVVSP